MLYRHYRMTVRERGGRKCNAGECMKGREGSKLGMCTHTHTHTRTRTSWCGCTAFDSHRLFCARDKAELRLTETKVCLLPPWLLCSSVTCGFSPMLNHFIVSSAQTRPSPSVAACLLFQPPLLPQTAQQRSFRPLKTQLEMHST